MPSSRSIDTVQRVACMPEANAAELPASEDLADSSRSVEVRFSRTERKFIHGITIALTLLRMSKNTPDLCRTAGSSRPRQDRSTRRHRQSRR